MCQSLCGFSGAVDSPALAEKPITSEKHTENKSTVDNKRYLQWVRLHLDVMNWLNSTRSPNLLAWMDCRRSCQAHSHIELKTPNINAVDVLEEMSVWLQIVGKEAFGGGDSNFDFIIILKGIFRGFSLSLIAFPCKIQEFAQYDPNSFASPVHRCFPKSKKWQSAEVPCFSKHVRRDHSASLCLYGTMRLSGLLQKTFSMKAHFSQ